MLALLAQVREPPLLRLAADGSVKASTLVGFPLLPLSSSDRFGSSITSFADLDGDLFPDEGGASTKLRLLA